MTDILDPHGVAGLANVRVLRQSIIGSADICLKRAGYDMVPNRPYVTGEARAVGTAYHAGLELYYRARADGEIVDRHQIQTAALDSFAKEAAAVATWDSSEMEAAQKITKMVDAYFDGGHQWPDNYRVIGVEQEWFAPLFGEWILKGTIDLVLEDEMGIVLADHKTAGRMWPQGKEHARKNQQAVIYCWAWWYLTGATPQYMAFDVMTYAGKFERRPSYPTSHHMQSVLDKAIGLTKVIEALGGHELPANTSSALCSEKYCDHWEICPFGAAGA